MSEILYTANERGDGERVTFIQTDTAIKAIVDAIVRNERYRLNMATLREGRKFRRRIRKAAAA